MEGRLFYTFFWFWQYNSVDELAFEVLRDGNVDKSINLLENQLTSDNLTPQYYSTAKNLFCLYLASFSNGSMNPERLSKCILWAGRFFENEQLDGYVTWISGPQYPFDRQKTISVLVDEFIKFSMPFVNKLT